MICINFKDVEEVNLPNGVSLRWLTHKDLGGEEYVHNHNLRQFTVKSGVTISVHEHKFVEIIYILSGNLVFLAEDKGGKYTEYEVGPGDYIYIATNEKHGLRNESSETAIMLCFSDCVDDKANCTKK